MYYRPCSLFEGNINTSIADNINLTVVVDLEHAFTSSSDSTGSVDFRTSRIPETPRSPRTCLIRHCLIRNYCLVFPTSL